MDVAGIIYQIMYIKKNVYKNIYKKKEIEKFVYIGNIHKRKRIYIGNIHKRKMYIEKFVYRFFVCRFLCIYKKKEMRRKMFIKNIVYKKWYIVFCVYAIFCVYIIFIILCKKTLTSRNAKNLLRAKIFYTFLFFSLSKRVQNAKIFIFRQISISFN